MEHPRIIYWKWSAEDFEGEHYLAKARDLLERSVFDMIYISLVWTGRALTDAHAQRALRKTAELFHSAGRRMMLDIDVRPKPERLEFCRRWPDALQGLCRTELVALDGRGRAAWTSEDRATGDHYGDYPVLRSELLHAWAFAMTADDEYDPATLADVTGECVVTECEPGHVGVEVGLGETIATHVLFMATHYFEYPDVFSPEVEHYQQELLAACADLPLDGACIDEWGAPPYPGFDFSGAWRCPWYSAQMAERYREAYGRDFLLDVLNQRLAPAGDEGARVRAISDFHRFVRGRIVATDTAFCATVKRLWGDGAFIGVHPTWFAIEETADTPEIWKNGLDWWEIEREYAQTDEVCPYPVRLALAHRWGGKPFYNMWYSMGTLDVATYFTEAWDNARAGGRTHTLSFWVDRERDGVLELGRPGLLEQVSAIEERMAMLNRFQRGLPHADVVVAFGEEALFSHLANPIRDGCWAMADCLFERAFRIGVELWRAGVTCLLVPAYEMDNGRLRPEGGKVVYGTNAARCLVFAYPQFASRATLDALSEFAEAGLLSALIGEGGVDNRGRDASPVMSAIRRSVPCVDEPPATADLLKLLKGAGVSPNTIVGGRRFTDGSVVVAQEGPVPAGRPLAVDFMLDGRRVQAECTDILGIKLGGDGQLERLCAPALRRLRVDGKLIVDRETPEDTLIGC